MPSEYPGDEHAREQFGAGVATFGLSAHLRFQDYGIDPGKPRDYSSALEPLRTSNPDWLWLHPPYLHEEAGLSERAIA